MVLVLETYHKQMTTACFYIIKMQFKNPISKIEREKLKDLLAMKKALIKKGVITNAEIKKCKN